MCILIAITIKIRCIHVTAGNGPNVQSARAPAINRRHAHETSTRTHARDNTHTMRTHTRRRRACTFVRTCRWYARTRNVHAKHSREHTHTAATRECAHARTYSCTLWENVRGVVLNVATLECVAIANQATLCE